MALLLKDLLTYEPFIFTVARNPNLLQIVINGIQTLGWINITGNPLLETLQMPDSLQISELYISDLPLLTVLELPAVTTIMKIQLNKIPSLDTVIMPLLTYIGISRDLNFQIDSGLILKESNFTTWPFPGLLSLGITSFMVCEIPTPDHGKPGPDHQPLSH